MSLRAASRRRVLHRPAVLPPHASPGSATTGAVSASTASTAAGPPPTCAPLISRELARLRAASISADPGAQAKRHDDGGEGVTNCWPSRISANRPERDCRAQRRDRRRGQPECGDAEPTRAATPAPGQIRPRRAPIRYPAPAVTTTASQQTATGLP
jgi:hypothetical protein